MSSFDTSHDSETQKKYSNFCSTPVLAKKLRKASTSISTVEPNSSSGTKATSANVIQGIVKKKKVLKRKIQKEKSKQRPEKKSDSDWETYVCSQTSLHSTNSDNDVLFKDIGSPERVREAPRLFEEHLESPILSSKRRLIGSPKRITFEKKDSVSPKELPCVNLVWNDGNEETLRLNRQNVLRTYPEPRAKKRPKKGINIDTNEKCLRDVPITTTYSNLLWDDFVKKNEEKVRKYLVPCSSSKQKSSKKKSYAFEEGSNSIMNNDFELHVPKNMGVVSGRWDKSLRKWIRISDVYEFHGDEEKMQMSLNEFLKKKRATKKKMKILNSSSTRDSIAKCSNETRSEQKRSKGCVDLTSPKRRNVMIIEIQDLKLEQMNKIREFTSRLGWKTKPICNKISLNQPIAATATSTAVSSKPVNDHNTVVSVTDDKRQTVTRED